MTPTDDHNIYNKCPKLMNIDVEDIWFQKNDVTSYFGLSKK